MSRALSDRERILAEIAHAFVTPLGWATLKGRDPTMIGYLPPELVRPGDLVKVQHLRDAGRWTVGWYLGTHFDEGGKYVLLRDVASADTCRIYNARVVGLNGIPRHRLLAGHQHRAYEVATRAIEAANDDPDNSIRFFDLSFPDLDSRDGTLWLCPRLFHAPSGRVAVARPVPLRATSRLRVRPLAEAIRAAVPSRSVWEETAVLRPGSKTWVVKPDGVAA